MKRLGERVPGVTARGLFCPEVKRPREDFIIWRRLFSQRCQLNPCRWLRSQGSCSHSVSLSDSITHLQWYKSHCQRIPQTLMTLKPISPAPASLLSASHDSNSLLSSLPGSSTAPQPHAFQLQLPHFSISVKDPVPHPFIHAKGSSETPPLPFFPRSFTFHFLKVP